MGDTGNLPKWDLHPSLIGFAVALKTSRDREGAANVWIWIARAFVNLPPQLKVGYVCMCWEVRTRLKAYPLVKAGSHWTYWPVVMGEVSRRLQEVSLPLPP